MDLHQRRLKKQLDLLKTQNMGLEKRVENWGRRVEDLRFQVQLLEERLANLKKRYEDSELKRGEP